MSGTTPYPNKAVDIRMNLVYKTESPISSNRFAIGNKPLNHLRLTYDMLHIA